MKRRVLYFLVLFSALAGCKKTDFQPGPPVSNAPQFYFTANINNQPFAWYAGKDNIVTETSNTTLKLYSFIPKYGRAFGCWFHNISDTVYDYVDVKITAFNARRDTVSITDTALLASNFLNTIIPGRKIDFRNFTDSMKAYIVIDQNRRLYSSINGDNDKKYVQVEKVERYSDASHPAGCFKVSLHIDQCELKESFSTPVKLDLRNVSASLLMSYR